MSIKYEDFRNLLKDFDDRIYEDNYLYWCNRNKLSKEDKANPNTFKEWLFSKNELFAEIDVNHQTKAYCFKVNKYYVGIIQNENPKESIFISSTGAFDLVERASNELEKIYPGQQINYRFIKQKDLDKEIVEMDIDSFNEYLFKADQISLSTKDGLLELEKANEEMIDDEDYYYNENDFLNDLLCSNIYNDKISKGLEFNEYGFIENFNAEEFLDKYGHKWKYDKDKYLSYAEIANDPFDYDVKLYAGKIDNLYFYIFEDDNLVKISNNPKIIKKEIETDIKKNNLLSFDKHFNYYDLINPYQQELEEINILLDYNGMKDQLLYNDNLLIDKYNKKGCVTVDKEFINQAIENMNKLEEKLDEIGFRITSISKVKSSPSWEKNYELELIHKNTDEDYIITSPISGLYQNIGGREVLKLMENDIVDEWENLVEINNDYLKEEDYDM